MARVKWADVLKRAAEIVADYDTGVTLRQLFYRLVAEQILENTDVSYKTLSSRTAEARRDGTFPELMDRTRTIHRFTTFEGTADARTWLKRIYRRERTEGQPHALYLGVEKNTMVAQLTAWFGDMGIPIVALGGYSSQTYVDKISSEAREDGRPAVLIYAGDHDPSGEDIDRDFRKRTDCFSEFRRIAVNHNQVDQYQLPPAPGKKADTRAAGFIKRHGVLMQVELEALAPEIVRELYEDAINDFWDTSEYAAVLEREAAEREEL